MKQIAPVLLLALVLSLCEGKSLRCSGTGNGRNYCGQGIIVEAVENGGDYKQWVTVATYYGDSLNFKYKKSGKVTVYTEDGTEKYNVNGQYDGLKVGCTLIGNRKTYDPFFVQVYGYPRSGICYDYMLDSVTSACRMLGETVKGRCKGGRSLMEKKTSVVEEDDDDGDFEEKRQTT